MSEDRIAALPRDLCERPARAAPGRMNVRRGRLIALREHGKH
jgi:hypothetical protein